MPSTRKIIRVFLASPGDLQEERHAIREVVEEYNGLWANELGYQVELIGWEETIAGFGRPQSLINQDLDRCDLFLGMIWKRWGTPPDTNGVFSSGFEEEFERSIARRENGENLEISMFFKQIPNEFMIDPGEDLKKVLDFRKRIIAGKKILFQNFSTLRDVESLARKCITAYVNHVRAEDISMEPDEIRAKRTLSGSVEVGEDDNERELSPLSAEGFSFLEFIVERIRHPDSLDELTASEVARFRLLANLISKPGNEKMNLGVHDINILYTAYRQGMELGEREIRFLSRLGFQHMANENVPLWCWYSDLAESQYNPAFISSFVAANDNEKIGAISVLTALSLHFPSDNDLLKRDDIISNWFSENSSDTVRIAALGYLSRCGTTDDFEIAKKEYDRSDFATSRSALECMISILVRAGQMKAAQELVIESQFETLNSDLLTLVLTGIESLETSALLLGIEHRNSLVRLHSMKSLFRRDEINIGLAERLAEDSDALVRNEAVKELLNLGKLLSEEEIRQILVRPQNQPARGRFSLGTVNSSDAVGKDLYQQYQSTKLKKLSETELEKMIGASLIYDDAAYFALVEKHFAKHVDELRRNVDDRFGRYFEDRIRRTEAAVGSSANSRDLVRKSKDLEDFQRKSLTRKGLNILCAAKKPDDLHRIRENLRDGYAGPSVFDAEYLQKYGDWNDISLLANAGSPQVGTTLLTMSSDENYQDRVATTITKIGKKQSISDILSLEIPPDILTKIIKLCAESRFAEITRDVVLSLFSHESDKVRKAASVLAIQAFPTKRIKSILNEYIGADKYRYYNVVHWLDLGASMSRGDAKKVARSVVNY